jgi:hypothetical protein
MWDGLLRRGGRGCARPVEIKRLINTAPKMWVWAFSEARNPAFKTQSVMP